MQRIRGYKYRAYPNKKQKDLRIRSWICPSCGAGHDRDVNAAKNILEKDLEMLAS